MKDSLFEMLLTLFEQSLAQIQEDHHAPDIQALETEEEWNDSSTGLFIQSAKSQSMRVLTYSEQMRLTKASYQFLMRMKLCQVIDNDLFELIMHELDLSDSRIINLEETKWAMRRVLSSTMNAQQLAFLDLVLYQSEDKRTKH